MIFRYRLEIPDCDNRWYWHRDAAILEASNHQSGSRVVDEANGEKIMIEWRDGQCINYGFRDKVMVPHCGAA